MSFSNHSHVVDLSKPARLLALQALRTPTYLHQRCLGTDVRLY